MKKIIIIGLTALVFVSCSENKESDDLTDENIATETKGYTIDCDFRGVDISKAYLSQYVKGNWAHKDSADVVEGKFSFSGEVELPEVWYIKFDDKKAYVSLFIENSKISISGATLNRDSVTILGSAIHDALNKFNDGQEGFYNEIDKMEIDYMAAREIEDTATMNQITLDYEVVSERINEYIVKYIGDNTSSVLAPYLAVSNLLNVFTANQIDSTLTTFSKDIKDSKYIVVMQEKSAKMRATEVGAVAPLFTQNDPEGNPISLESFRGNYLLIDFWASWCGPCRKENPNVVAAYNKYNDMGFDILGVSLDDNGEKWIAAIDKDGLTWSQVGDLKGWANEVGQLYGVNSIPHSILLDKDGVIIAKNLRGKELHEKLEEVLISE
jgi:thiol-disulfide isomerase/thioredoxin